jgi:hypothetical protein
MDIKEIVFIRRLAEASPLGCFMTLGNSIVG